MIDYDVDDGSDGNQNGQEIDAGPDGEAQIKAPRIARNPKEPTSRERELHEVLHLPLRSWCKHCMMGRGKDSYHMRLGDSGDSVPRIGMDYMFLTERGITTKADEVTGECMTLLVLKDFFHKSIWVYPVEGKGVAKSEWVSGMIQTDMATCGMDNSMIVVKTDQEPAIREVQRELAIKRRASGSTGHSH